MLIIADAKAIVPVLRPLSPENPGSRVSLEFGAAVMLRVITKEKPRVGSSAHRDKARCADAKRDSHLGRYVDIIV